MYETYSTEKFLLISKIDIFTTLFRLLLGIPHVYTMYVRVSLISSRSYCTNGVSSRFFCRCDNGQTNTRGLCVFSIISTYMYVSRVLYFSDVSRSRANRNNNRKSVSYCRARRAQTRWCSVFNCKYLQVFCIVYTIWI